MRKVLIWIVGLFAFLVLGIVGAYFLAKKYEEPVRNYIVAQVNKRLQSPVHVGDINFSFLSRFPSASLVMDSVWAEENIIKIGKPDTLFYFEKVYLNLNILDILNGQYRINEIETRDGFMRLKIDEQGNDNFHIWKESEDTTGFLLELNEVHIERSMLDYVNLARQQEYHVYAHELDFNGRFSSESYTMKVSGEGLVKDIVIKGTSYVHERFVDLETELDVFTEEGRYALKSGQFEIDNELDFTLAGSITDEQIDLRITGEKLDIIRSLSLIPSANRTWLDGYSSSGSLTFDCTMKGVFGRTENPAIEATYSFSNASITKSGSNWKLTDLSGSGSISNGKDRTLKTTNISIQGLEGRLNGDPISASFSVTNFIQPSIDGHAKLSTDLAALVELTEWTYLEEPSGRVVIDAELSTTLVNPDSSAIRYFLNSKANGIIELYDASFRLKADERQFRIDTAQLAIKNNALIIDRYAGALNDCKIELDGQATNFLNFLFSDRGKLDITGNIKTGELNLNELFPSSSGSEGGVVVAFPKRASWNLNIIAESFVLGKFRAEEISGVLVMNSFKSEASSLHFRSQDGDVQGKVGIYRFDENQFGLRTDFETRGVDVKQLFTTFNNFGQDFITADVLQGKIDAEVQFQGLCDSLLNIDMNSIVASADLRILNGQLNNFEPLISVADEIKKKPMLRLFVATDELRKRLQTVKFDTLENQITIREGLVQIPQMDIRSSAIDLSVSGTHSFENEINYELDFALSEVLELKNRKEPYNEFVRRDQRGRTRLYITMVGSTDDFEIEIKRTDVRQTFGRELNDEKNTIKGLLNKEFGIFEGDTNLLLEEEEQALPFEFDPEAGTLRESKDSTKVQKAETEPMKKKRTLDKLIKKTETDKKKLRDGDFEDDDF